MVSTYHVGMTLFLIIFAHRLYLFFLPFQVVGAFGYLTIPGTAFSAFLLLGFLEIGQESALPILDEFICASL
jgi:predicted membrane chloride channel (bestrophin family)